MAENIFDLFDSTESRELLQVPRNLRQTYREIFLDGDSGSEFEGFEEDDISSDGSTSGDDEWEEGDSLIRGGLNVRFSGDTGIKGNIPHDPKAIDFVNLFIKEEDFVDMTNETNRYATEYLQSHDISNHSRFNKWPSNGITATDMKCFLAMTVAMGLTHQEDLHDYWSCDPVLATPFYPSIMSRDYFMNILSFFHLSDNTQYIPRGQEGYDPLQKLGDVFKRIMTRFEESWYPSQNLCIDEGMIPYRGQVHMKVYAPDKPNKYGLKLYELCDSSNAYCCRLELYTGKTESVSIKGKTHDLVMRLMHPYLNRGHTLFVDNYYSSPALFMELHENGTTATGTARNRKGVPSVVLNAKLKSKGDLVVYHKGPLMCMKIKDRKDVKMLSTCHSSTSVQTGKRDHRGHEIQRCQSVHEYNQYMGAVDRSDQMVSYSSFRRKTLKWWKKVFFHIFSLSILNAWILYREWCCQREIKPCLQRVFRRDYVKQLLDSVNKLPSEVVKSGRRASLPVEPLRRLQGRHFPSKLRSEPGKRRPTRRCAVCNPAERQILKSLGMAERKRPGRESSYECKECGVGLCVAPCFRLYHEYENYVLAYRRNEESSETDM